jgi:filamentous hemagglutinin family protein
MKICLQDRSILFREGVRFIAGVILLGLIFSRAEANPVGPSVVAGQASVSGVGTAQVTIEQATPKAILSWQQFNIAPNEVTRFIQPSAQAMALNRILDANPSQIFGSLQANGIVLLLNPNGVLFGPGSQVNVNGLVASSLNLSDGDFMNGRHSFSGSALNGAVRNAGTIETKNGGFVYLLAPNVENSGLIKSPEGEILLAAGTIAYLSNRPDGLGFLVEVAAPAGEAVNLKELIADGGGIRLFGRAVNQSGLIQANNVRKKNGRIELFASEKLDIKSGSRTSAAGAGPGSSNGGTVIARSDKGTGQTSFYPGAVIDVSGGPAGGSGGLIELSGHEIRLGGAIKAAGGQGGRGGILLLDPFDLIVDQSFFETLLGNQSGVAEMTFQADHDIDVRVDLSQSNAPDLFTNWAAGGKILRFTAGNDLRFTNSWIFDNLEEGAAGKWKFVATAGNDIVLRSSAVWVGNSGGIELTAGRDIRLEQISGGRHSYLWTMAGGEIRLHAGEDLVAPSAFDAGSQRFSGIRLDGGFNNDRAGHLTVDVGRNFIGGIIDGLSAGPGFFLSNGTARIRVGGRFGSPDQYGNLTFGKGEIVIQTDGDLFLGLIQDQGLTESVDHRLTIAPGNVASLVSVEGDIHLRPTPLGSTGNTDLLAAFYPASFRVEAKSGSIFVEKDLHFWPSGIGAIEFSAKDEIRGASNGTPPSIWLYNIDPEELTAVDSSEVPSLLRDPTMLAFRPSERTMRDEALSPAAVSFKTEEGDISRLQFRFNSPSLRKEITIESGHDLKEFAAELSVPEGSTAVLRAKRDIDMGAKVENNPSGAVELINGITFFGLGEGRISAGRDFNLADSNGIQHQLLFSNEHSFAGLLNISVGGDLKMTQSKIWTYNGASIQIHGPDGVDRPIGGKVDVGTNEGLPGADRGIVTLRGGDISIRAAGDVNVNASRIATIAGGNIQIASTGGNINAGSGSPDDQVQFFVPAVFLDGNGNPVLDNSGRPVLTARSVLVPGSGIFTFHDADPAPLPPYPPKPVLALPPFQPIIFPPPPQPAVPPFPDKTPAMIRLEREILKQRVIGHDSSRLEAELLNEFQIQSQGYQLQVSALFSQYQNMLAIYKSEAESSYQSQLQAYKDQAARLQTAADQQYEALKAEHRKGWKLGDISLTASGPTGAVIVPPAGIRGKKISIVAKTLDLQGGQIGGDSNIVVDRLIGDQAQIKGPGEIKVGDQTLGEITLPPLPALTLPVLPPFALPSIPTAGSTGSAGLGGLSGSVGSISAVSSGSITAASNTVAAVQEKATEQAAVEAEQVVEAAAADTDIPEAGRKESRIGSGEGKKRKPVTKRSFQIRRGVLIQVELNEEGALDSNE